MSNRPKTDLENYLVYGVDEKNRKVFFGNALAYNSDEFSSGAVSQSSIQYAIRSIHRMVDDHPKTPIEIHMCSFGGCPYAMLALYDLMQSVPTQFRFYGSGAIMSAASWIMAGSDERHLYPNTTIMIHDGWDGYEGKFTDFVISSEQGVRLQEKLEEIYADNSRMPKEFWHEVCKRDLYMTAEEVVFLGLADRVVQPKKRGNLRKIRQHHLGQNIDKVKMDKMINKLFKRVKINSKVDIIIPEYKPEPNDDKIIVELDFSTDD
jgi:ATP-dependent Clp protease, protease subunit